MAESYPELQPGTLVAPKIKKGTRLDGDETGMLNAMENPVDFTKKENIKELVSYARRV